MPYALHDADGSIVSLHRQAEAGAQYLPDDHPQVLAFVGADAASAGFARLDADLVRVLEDLIDVLIARQVIRITDLPVEAQQKLFSRKSFRERRSPQALRLYADDGDEGIVHTDFAGI